MANESNEKKAEGKVELSLDELEGAAGGYILYNVPPRLSSRGRLHIRIPPAHVRASCSSLPQGSNPRVGGRYRRRIGWPFQGHSWGHSWAPNGRKRGGNVTACELS